MTFATAKERRVELVFLAVWVLLLAWVLCDGVGDGLGLRGPAFVLLLCSCILGSVSRFMRSAGARRILVVTSLATMAIAVALFVR